MGRDVVAILGARGMLGSDVMAACTQKGFHMRPYDLPEFDITRPEQLERAIRSADAVIDCAAYANVDTVESRRDLVHRVNTEAVGLLGRIAADGGKWILHFSTDYPSPARRPLNSRFNCDRIQECLDKPIRPWWEPLASFLRQL